MKFTLKPMNEEEARMISEWHYEDSYSFYDFNNDLEDAREFLDFTNRPVNKYFSVINEAGELAGFYEFKQKDNGIEIGLGMRPNLTGRGLGLSFLESGIEFIKEKFSPNLITLQVLSSNRRAQIVYERAGSKATRLVMVKNDLGMHEFVEMALTDTRPL